MTKTSNRANVSTFTLLTGLGPYWSINIFKSRIIAQAIEQYSRSHHNQAREFGRLPVEPNMVSHFRTQSAAPFKSYAFGGGTGG